MADLAADSEDMGSSRMYSTSLGRMPESAPLLPESSTSRHSLSSPHKTLGNLIISIVGAGVLGLPYAFKKSGLLFSLIALAAMAVVSYYGMLLLVKSRRKLEQVLGEAVSISSYGELAYKIFGNVGLWTVDVMIFLSQGGFCIAYLIFIGQNISSVLTGGTEQKTLIILILAPLQMLLSWLRSLTLLAPSSIFADIINCFAFAIVIYHGFREFHGFSDIPMFTGFSNAPVAIGVAVYAYEGVGMTLSLESSMKDRSRFNYVLALGLSIIAVLYALVGTMGYLGYGKDTQEIITLNLPQNWTTDLVKLGISIALFFTFPVMMHPVHEIHERRLTSWLWVQEKISADERMRKVFSRISRSLVVLLVVGVAIGVPHFSTFISLIGSSVCSVLAFILPALLHTQVMGRSISTTELVANYMLVTFGAIFGIWGTYDSIRRIYSH